MSTSTDNQSQSPSGNKVTPSKNQQAQRAPNQENYSLKKKKTALLLCIFFGVTGAHRFYIGKIKSAIVMLLTVGGFGIWVLIDIILIMFDALKDKQNKPLSPLAKKDMQYGQLFNLYAYIVVAFISFGAYVIFLIFLSAPNLRHAPESQLAAIRSGDLIKAYQKYTAKEYQKITPLKCSNNSLIIILL